MILTNLRQCFLWNKQTNSIINLTMNHKYITIWFFQYGWSSAIYIYVCISNPNFFILRIPTDKKVNLYLQLLALYATPDYTSKTTAKMRVILKTKMGKLRARLHSFIFNYYENLGIYIYVFFSSRMKVKITLIHWNDTVWNESRLTSFIKL